MPPRSRSCSISLIRTRIAFELATPALDVRRDRTARRQVSRQASERARDRAFASQAEQAPHGLPQRGPRPSSEPRGPHVVAGGHACAGVHVARRRRVRMDRQARGIRKSSSGAVKVEREQCVLAAENVARVHERIAPEGRRVGGPPDAGIERAFGHQLAGRVFARVGADEQARGDDRDVRPRIEQACGLLRPAGRSLCVVVAKRDVAHACGGRAGIGTGRRMHEYDVGKAAANQGGGAGDRCIVDDDDCGSVGQRRAVRRRAREFGRVPEGRHDGGHARFRRRQAVARGRDANVTSRSSRQYVWGPWRLARI